jgi:anaerobic magnesium-protoporphyrin IX monomethyl ester cyclase
MPNSPVSNLDNGRVVLVNPPIRLEEMYGEFASWGSVAPPTGLCYIAAVLRKEGYQVSIVDGCAERLGVEEIVTRVVADAPDLVGVTCKSIFMPNVTKLCPLLKGALPGVPIVAGGSHVTALPEETLRELPSIDAIVVGEGEQTFRVLTAALLGGRPFEGIEGLCIRRNGAPWVTPRRARIEQLDELPYPAFDLLPDLATHYWPALTSTKRLPAFSLMTSRGCQYRCTFCDRSVFGNHVTYHGAEYILSLIHMLRRLGDSRYIYFEDDNFLLNPELDTLLRKLRESRLPIEFSCQSRVDSVDDDLLRTLRASGCRQIFYGVETGSKRLLHAMKKGIRVDDVPGVVAKTRGAGIESMAMLILGYPGETIESLEETLALLKSCRFDDVGLFYFAPLPGSEVYKDAATQGTFNGRWDQIGGFDRPVYVPHGLTEEILRKYYERFYSACYFRPHQVANPFKRFPTGAHLRAYGRYLLTKTFGARV